MTKIFLTAVILLFSFEIPGQIQKEVSKILLYHDFCVFENYADTVSNNTRSIETSWEQLRDLTYQFREGVFYIEQQFWVKDSSYAHVSTFKIRMITAATAIIFYEISEQKFKQHGNEWLPYYVPLKRYRNDSEYSILQDSFKSVYGKRLVEKELFDEDIVFGKACGNTGSKPAGRVKLDKLVKSNNQAELYKMLQSTNTEKQFYAIDGFHQLFERGIKLTAPQLKLIRYILNKKGTLNTCGGCLYIQQEISNVAKKFVF